MAITCLCWFGISRLLGRDRPYYHISHAVAVSQRFSVLPFDINAAFGLYLLDFMGKGLLLQKKHVSNNHNLQKGRFLSSEQQTPVMRLDVIKRGYATSGL